MPSLWFNMAFGQGSGFRFSVPIDGGAALVPFQGHGGIQGRSGLQDYL